MTQDQQGISGKIKVRATSAQRKTGMVICLLVLLGLIGVAVLEAVHFDIGRLFTPCGFKVKHGLPCPTCGYTTALRAFASGHVFHAFTIQPAASLIYLALVCGALIGGYVAISGHYPHWLRQGMAGVTPKLVALVLLAVVLVGWGVLLVRALV